MQTSPTAAVDLYWIPLGAGGHSSVRFNGRVFEAIEAARQHRGRCDLYHAALVVELEGDRYTIEVAPSWDADEASRGAVATGPVGRRYVGWLRLFRYEVRCWRGGSIPDLAEAVGGPRRLTSDPRVARRLLDLVATVPTPCLGTRRAERGRDVELELRGRVADRPPRAYRQTACGHQRAVAPRGGPPVSRWLGADATTDARRLISKNPPPAARASDRVRIVRQPSASPRCSAAASARRSRPSPDARVLRTQWAHRPEIPPPAPKAAGRRRHRLWLCRAESREAAEGIRTLDLLHGNQGT